MNIRLLNRTFDIDPLTVIVRDNGVYAKVQLPGRDGQTFTHYVPVDRRLTGMLYDQPQPCQSLTIWRPTITLPIWELGYYREGSRQPAIPGVNLTMCNVRIVLTLPEAA